MDIEESRKFLYQKHDCAKYKQFVILKLSTNSNGFNEKPNVSGISKDYIGPPDIKSNIRPVVRHIPQNETKTERLLRSRAIEIEKWNQDIWESHNKRFFDVRLFYLIFIDMNLLLMFLFFIRLQEREAFVAANKPKDSDTVSADKMSEFYKHFLDKNWSLHFYYNVSWYLKNFELLVLSAQVNISKIFRKIVKK